MKIRALLSLLACTLTAGQALAQDQWMTVGKAAYQHARQLPGVKVIDSSTAGAVANTERVYLLRLPSASVSQVSQRLHDKMRRCGGFMHHPDERTGRRELARHAAVPLAGQIREGGPDYEIVNQAQVVPALAAMQEASLGQTIRDLSAFPNRYYNSTHGAKASQWLMEQWNASAARHGAMQVEQFVHAGYAQRSVVATIPGTDLAGEVVVLGAHLDSIGGGIPGNNAIAPGADDDASGVAGLSEIIRVLAEAKYRPRRTIKLIAYAAEEVGLRGSRDIARDFKQRTVNVVGVLQLDMTNYKGPTADIFLIIDYTDARQNTFLGELIETYLPTLTVGVETCGYACSDHASWHAEGYATSMPFEADMSQLNPHIHTKRDTWANSGSQAAHALKFARLGAAYAIELGSSQGK